ncbi:hypothetical protein ACRBEV_22835 [Methylobacterium phyllosphaerae]
MGKPSSAGGFGSLRDRADRALAQGVYLLIRRTLHVKSYGLAIRLVRSLTSLSSTDVSTAALERVFEAYAGAGEVAHSAPAQRDLLKIGRIFPENGTLFSRLLRLGAYADLNPEITKFIQRTATALVLRDPEIGLLLLFQRIKNEDFSGTVQAFRAIPLKAIETDPVLLDVWRISFIHLILKNDSEYFENFDPNLFVKFVETEREPNIIVEILMKLLYKPIRPDLIDETVDLLSTRIFEDAPENFAAVYFFLMSCGHVAQGLRLEGLNARHTEGTLHPLYVRGRLGPLELREQARVLSARDLERTAQDPSPWRWRTAGLLKAEIGQRLRNAARAPDTGEPSTAAARPHLLVAFFGQMRFPTRTLPGIKRWIDANFAGPESDVDVSYGVATWRATGSKVITLEDSFEYLHPYFPPACEPVLRRMPLAHVSDAPGLFPRLSESVLKRLAATSDVVIEAEIERLLEANVHFAISSDAHFMDDTGSLIADFAPTDRHMLNQGRMLDRIGAVGGIINALDRAGRPVTHVLFIRPDLHALSGSIAACLDHMRDKRNWTVVDQDHLAELIEGVGDRLILADRTAAAHIIGMRDRVRRLFRAVPRDDLACSRLSPHQMLASVLFEHSVEVRTVPKSEITWDFLRANFTWQDFLPELRDDVAWMDEGPIKRDLLAAITA